MNAPTEPVTYALLTDGTTVEIRPTRPDDFEAVRDMHAGMSPENLYMRFFGISRVAAEQEARRVCREPAPDRAALLAILDGRVIGCISYQMTGTGRPRSPWRSPTTCTAAVSARCCWNT